MDTQGKLHTNDATHILGFLGGMVVGGLTGAVAVLLVAPQAGKKTRADIQQKSNELRKQTTEAVEEALAQTRIKANQVKNSVYDQAEAIQHHGQDMLDDQKEYLSTLVENGKKAVQDILS